MRDDHLERDLNGLRDDTLAGPFKDWHFTPEIRKKVLEKVRRERGTAKGFFSMISERRWGMAATVAALALVLTFSVAAKVGPTEALQGLWVRLFSPGVGAKQPDISAVPEQAQPLQKSGSAWQTIEGNFYAGQIADLNGDGQSELLLAVNQSGQNMIQTWTFADGLYNQQSSAVYSSRSDGLAVGDTNGNGLPEVIGTTRDNPVTMTLIYDASGEQLGQVGKFEGTTIQDGYSIELEDSEPPGAPGSGQASRRGSDESGQGSTKSASEPDDISPDPGRLSALNAEPVPGETPPNLGSRTPGSPDLDGRGLARAPAEPIRTPNIYIWENSAEPKVLWKGTAAGMIWDLSIVDVTGDSTEELVVVGNVGSVMDPKAPGYLEIWQWNKTPSSGNEYGLLATATNFASANTGVVVRDFDGDRKKEILVSNLQEGLLAYHVENGRLVSLWRSPELSGRIRAADVNGDKVPEVILWTDDRLRILNMKDKNLRPLDGGTITLSERLLEVVAVADVNNDGVEDVLFSREREGSFYYLTRKSGNLELVPLELAGRVTAVGDVDNDGRNELVVITSDGKVRVGELGEPGGPWGPEQR